jgi:hypothetical protein
VYCHWERSASICGSLGDAMRYIFPTRTECNGLSAAQAAQEGVCGDAMPARARPRGHADCRKYATSFHCG